MWELDWEEVWVPKNRCFWTVVLVKILESPLDCKEIQPVHSEGDQPWDFFGKNDAKAEIPVLWPPHAKSWLIGKDWCWEGLGAKGELFGKVIKLTSVSQSVQWLSRARLFATPWTTARQASLSITDSRSPHKPMSIESVMPSNHLILCHPLLLPSIFPGIRVFSNESTLHIRWPKYWNFSFSISPSNEHPGLISFRMGWLDLLTV